MHLEIIETPKVFHDMPQNIMFIKRFLEVARDPLQTPENASEHFEMAASRVERNSDLQSHVPFVSTLRQVAWQAKPIDFDLSLQNQARANGRYASWFRPSDSSGGAILWTDDQKVFMDMDARDDSSIGTVVSVLKAWQAKSDELTVMQKAVIVSFNSNPNPNPALKPLR